MSGEPSDSSGAHNTAHPEKTSFLEESLGFGPTECPKPAIDAKKCVKALLKEVTT
jgi:hypothetical protein